jgi:RNA polymerase sigma factor (sigma-70 family)
MGVHHMDSEAIQKHLGLVIKVAQKYKDLGVDLDDLVQEGMIGVMVALKNYNPEKGIFSTYATIWIAQKIRRYVENHSRNVRLPVWAGRAKYQAARYAERRRKLTGSYPGLDEIVDNVRLGISKRYIKSVVSTGFNHESSLDELIDDSRTLHDLIASDSEQADFEAHENLNIAMQALCERHRDVIRMRYFQDKTLEECGKSLGVCRERIRQIQSDALVELKKIIESLTQEPGNSTVCLRECAMDNT